MNQNAREFDLVVVGATGFTGCLAAEYLCERYGTGGDLRWALAGRNAEKLEAVKDRLGPAAAALPVVVADSLDQDAMNRLAERTAVVLTTVGPYALYGSALVSACAAAGTHYCDLTGEVQWIRRMIDQNHEGARASGARIVHCCGFDSIPMDIGAWNLQQETMRRHGSYCKSITLHVRAIKGAASGGTMASMMNIMREARADRSVARLLARPYSLNPDPAEKGPDRGDQRGIRHDVTGDSWTAPFVMASVNTRVVRRTHALLGYPWGADFRYDEAVRTGSGPAGWLRAASMTAGIAGLVSAASFGWSRNALERFVLPKPGEGPDAAARESGFFKLEQIGTLPDGTLVRGHIRGDRDPGYGSTSKMLSESAVCLAKDKLASHGGVLTPATAMGEALLQRLQANAGLTFEVLD
jgi:short subunit dehydrogenase-like uncharacterized protein